MSKTSENNLQTRAGRARIRDVAAAAGVSVGTVSNVINGRGNVSAKRRALVEEAIRELSFSGSLLAKGMRSQRFPVVGLCVPNATSFNFVAMSDELEAHSAKSGFELVQVITRHDPDREMLRIERLISSRVSGVLIVPTARSCSLFDRLVAVEMPTVAINHFGSKPKVDVVYEDRRSAFGLAARKLADRGYDAFLVATQFPNFAVVEENIAGLYQGAAEGGRSIRIDIIKASLTKEVYQKQLVETLGRARPETALIASSSLLAAWSIEALRKSGFRIPDDIGLVCAEEPAWAEASFPTLSCIDQPSTEIARAAWDLLSVRIAGARSPLETIRCDPHVNFRQSVRLG